MIIIIIIIIIYYYYYYHYHYIIIIVPVRVPQRGFSRMSLHQLSRHLSRMSTNSGFQHQFSTMSTTSGIFGDYQYGESYIPLALFSSLWICPALFNSRLYEYGESYIPLALFNSLWICPVLFSSRLYEYDESYVSL